MPSAARHISRLPGITHPARASCRGSASLKWRTRTSLRAGGTPLLRGGVVALWPHRGSASVPRDAAALPFALTPGQLPGPTLTGRQWARARGGRVLGIDDMSSLELANGPSATEPIAPGVRLPATNEGAVTHARRRHSARAFWKVGSRTGGSRGARP